LPHNSLIARKEGTRTHHMSLEEINSQFLQFKAALERPSPDLSQCAAMLSHLKIAMTQFSFLVPSVTPSPTVLKEIVLAREILEHAVLLSVKQRDMNAFARHIAQVKTYYFDTSRTFKDLPPSSRQYTILGLNLLRLLALNRIAEFHTELELIPLDKHENVFIQLPVQLEQYIMEGAYNKVYRAAKDVPHESYSFFIEYLMETRLKDEIAECSEKSYASLSAKEGARLLNFTQPAPFLNYAAERGWQVKGDEVSFKKEEAREAAVPSMTVIGQTLAYAKELERIV